MRRALWLRGAPLPRNNYRASNRSGYLKEWYFDIGTKVKAGEVLAEIDTPEVDQILTQAKAQLKMAQAASLSESDQIVGSPPPGLVDGDVVNVLK